MASRAIRGDKGRIDWGYFPAGAIHGYTVQRQPDETWTLRGTLISFDQFKLRQRPLVFIAAHAHGEWRWPVTTIDVGEGRGPRELQATLGPQLPEMITRVAR